MLRRLNPEPDFLRGNAVDLNVDTVDSYRVLADREIQVLGIASVEELPFHLRDGENVRIGHTSINNTVFPYP
jgi:hypothetical protein